jgi:hypothetical protein
MLAARLGPIADSDLLIERENLLRERAMAPPGKRISFSMRPWRHYFTRRGLKTTSKDRFSQGGSFSEKDKMLSQRAMALSRKRISFSMKPWRHHVTNHRLKTTSKDRFSLAISFSEKQKMLLQRAMALSKRRISFSMKAWRHRVTKHRLKTTSKDRFPPGWGSSGEGKNASAEGHGPTLRRKKCFSGL